jgi:hypothetical protein
VNRISITSGSPKRRDVYVDGARRHWRVDIDDNGIRRHVGVVE